MYYIVNFQINCIFLTILTYNKSAMSQSGGISLQNKLKLTNILLTICILLSPVFMYGCSRNKSQQQAAQLQAAKEKQAQEKESEKLKKIEAQIEMFFETLGGPSVKAEGEGDNSGGQQENTLQGGGQKGTQQQGTQQGDGQKGSQQQGTQQGGGQKGTQQQGTQQGGGQQKGTQKGGKQGGQQGGKQAARQEPDKWSQIGRIINNMHYQWNELMPEIAKKGVDMKLVDNFDNALNALTTTIESKDKEKVLTSANKLYSYIPDLYSLYRTKMSPEVKRMIYYTRNMILESGKDGWEQVGKDNEDLGKSWSLFHNTLEKEQKKTGDKLDFSIYELKKVVAEKNRQLTGIKGMIVLNNIKELQKSFEEKKS